MKTLISNIFDWLGRCISIDPTASSRRIAYLAVVFAGIILMYNSDITSNQLLALGSLLSATSLTAITGKIAEKDQLNKLKEDKDGTKSNSSDKTE